MAVAWRSLLQGTLGVVITVIVLVVCIAYFAVGLATRSHPDAYSRSTVRVADTVKIFRNSFGIPHVIGVSDRDVVFGQAWAHAQDRLWQMDVWRRTAQGRLAELFGAEMAQTDAFMRSLDLERITREQLAAMPPRSRGFLDAYANGVNAFLLENAESLPFEFDALGYRMEQWTPTDCLLVGKLLALNQSPALWNDITYSEICMQRGVAAMQWYVPKGPGAPYVLDSSTSAAEVYVPVAGADSTLSQLKTSLRQVSAAVRRLQGTIGIPGATHASNCWAVGRDTLGATLANDPHLNVSMPAYWYQVHLTSHTMNAVGLSIPGLPFVLSGRNDDVAWGITSAMVDNIDYVIEQVDQTNSNYYLGADGQRKKFQFRRDTIRIKDGADSLIDLRFTERGCVVSDGHPLNAPSKLLGVRGLPASATLGNSCLTLRWTAHYPSDEVGALYQINTASNVEGVQRALKTWGSPTCVFQAAQSNGTVASFGAGYVPLRKRADVLLPHRGSDTTAGWAGVTSIADVAYIKVSPRGSLASANNKLAPAGLLAQSMLCEPSSRIERITEQLSVYKNMTARDAQVLQQDVHSPYAVQCMQKLLPVLKRARPRYQSLEKQVLDTLEKWDGSMTTLSCGASIHAVMLQNLMWNTFEDELGTPLYLQWSFLSSIPTRRILELFAEPLHPLWDDLRTKTHENMSWIVVRSFQQTVLELRERFGSDVSSWNWGRLHTVTFPHPLGDHPLMRPVVNAGPHEVGGSNTTVFNTEWRIRQPYAVHNTASARVISDLADSVQFSVVPGGASGQPLDGHYTDQLQLWLKGGYVRLPVNRKPDVTFRLYQELCPASVTLPDS